MTWTPPRPEIARLVLEDGSVFAGSAFGARAEVVGEVCFNTGMCGYQEVLTDPSYAGQIVVMTAPQMGNYGITPFDSESARPQVAGFVVRSLSRPSSWRAVETLHEYLERCGVPGLFGVDTRAIARLLRERGALRAVLAPAEHTAAVLVQRARAWPGLENLDLAAVVTCARPYRLQPWGGSHESCDLRHDAYESAPASPLDAAGLHVVVYDFGVKRNILERLLARGCELTVVPATTPAQAVLELRPHGVLLSNGPGDPAAVGYAIESVRSLLGRVPLFGICLGHQILALALGARSYKLKFGHRGVNHPVHDLRTRKVRITAQNHGFAIDPESLPAGSVEVTELSLNDGTLEGMEHRSLPVFAVQYHPEAAPGPHDNDAHFDRFLRSAAAAAGLELPALAPPRRAQGGGRMPRRSDLDSVLVLGAGPIVIGQGCEFDYSGTQACRALREEGVRVILVNSNPASIMTDPEVADRTYVGAAAPRLPGSHPGPRAAPRHPADGGGPDGAQPGARTPRGRHPRALRGRVDRCRRRGDSARREPRPVRCQHASRRAAAGARRHGPLAARWRSDPGANRLAAHRAAVFTLGGSGGGAAASAADFRRLVEDGLRESPTGEVRVEECLVGWKEFELEADPRPRRQRHRHLLHREPRPDGSAHR